MMEENPSAPGLGASQTREGESNIENESRGFLRWLSSSIPERSTCGTDPRGPGTKEKGGTMTQDAPAGTPSDIVIERGEVHEFARAATPAPTDSLQEETPVAPVFHRATVASVRQKSGQRLVDLGATVNRPTGGVYLHLQGWAPIVVP